MTTQASLGRQSLPFHRRIGTLQNAEDPIFFLKNALHSMRGKDKKALKLPKMKQAHHGVNVCAWQKHAANCGWSRIIGVRSQFAGAKNLLPEIWGSAKKKPDLGVRRKNDLRLRARTSLQLALTQTATVRTIAIPLGKAAPGCGSEDLYAHSNTPASSLAWRTECLEFGVCVRADFAVEVNLFVPRGGPFHGKAPFGVKDSRRSENNMRQKGRE